MKQLKLRALDPAGPEGVFLVRVVRARHRWHGRKPSLQLELSILAPSEREGAVITSELGCGDKQQWMLRWFLRDFGCPAALLDNQINLDSLAGLSGVIRTSLSRSNHRLCLTLTGFAPAPTWPEFVEVAP